MIEEIVVRLPVKTLLRFKCVCKHWCDLIESRRFMNRHYCHDSNRDRLVFSRCLSYDYEENYRFEEANGDGVDLRMGPGYFFKSCMGPVNGVFCEVSRHRTIDLLNPATREVKRLPSLPPMPWPRDCGWLNLRFGFGLDPSTGDYKTVAFYGAQLVCVYSVSSECWRFIEGVDPSLLSTSLGYVLVEASWEELGGGFCNGVYYWVSHGILAFDMMTETFREIEAPGGVVGEEIYYGGVGVYRGSTALFLSRPIPFSSPLVLGRNDLWVLGDGGGWSKIFSFRMAPMSPSIPFLAGSTWIPICVWKNEMVLENDVYDIDRPNVIRVDIRTHKVTPLRLVPPVGEDVFVKMVADFVGGHRKDALANTLASCPRREMLLGAFSYKETLFSFKPKRNPSNQSGTKMKAFMSHDLLL